MSEENEFVTHEVTPEFDEFENEHGWEDEKTTLIEEGDEMASVWLRGDEGDVYEITEFPCILGRSNGADLQIKDTSLSREHTRILPHGGSFVAEDLNSLNGTFINDHRIERVILANGDLIRMGDLNFEYFTKDPIETGAPTRKLGQKKDKPKFGGLKKPNPKIMKLAIAGFGALAVMLMLAYVFKMKNKMSRAMITNAPVETVAPEMMEDDTEDPFVTDVTEGEVLETPIPPDITYTTTNENNIAEVTYNNANNLSRQANYVPDTAKNNVVPIIPETIKKEEIKEDMGEEKEVEETNEAEEQIDYYSHSKSRVLINTAREEYLDGYVTKSKKTLRKIISSNRYHKKYRTQAEDLKYQIQQMFKRYERGQVQYEKGKMDRAFKEWTKFLKKERKIFNTQSSVFAKKVKTMVVDEYMIRAEKAMKEGKDNVAYAAWSKAIKIDPNGPAADKLADLEARAKQAYQAGYRYESIDITKAIGYWKEVITIVPRGSRYYIKAQQKLKIYRRRGL